MYKQQPPSLDTRGIGAGVTQLRPGEVTVPLPEAPDAGVYFIGTIRTPWRSLKECPRRGDLENGPVCRIELDERWRQALTGMEERTHLQILYWMHRSRRDLVRQSPRSDGATIGTFAIRSPLRPNPIASSLVRLVAVEGATLLVRGLDCLDGTPVIDIKPDACPQATRA
jgi:tRNA-Thr(GGU) m(6)t(6)A37 methyltransferase TsaA